MTRLTARPPINFTVTRLGDATIPSTISYAVKPITATKADFQGGSFPDGLLRGMIAFAPGETSKTLQIIASDIATTGHTFTLVIASTNADAMVSPGAREAVGTIPSDPDPAFSIESGQPATATENGGRPAVSFRVVKTEGRYQDLDGTWHTAASVVSWRVVGIADTRPEDFGGAYPAGTVGFDVDQDEAFIIVQAPDSSMTPGRNLAGRAFQVTLGDAVPGRIDTRCATGRIPARVEVGVVAG